MPLKRKRSSPAFSPAASDTSDATTPSSPLSFFYHQTKPVAPLFDKPTRSCPTYDDQLTSQHLNSRTRKRHRDNRPDEQEVYASTIHRLREAQKQHPNAAPVPSQHTQVQPNAQPQRSTLHSVWRIPQAPIHTAMIVHSQDQARAESRCEDCEGPLRHSDAMDLDEVLLEEECRCKSCYRKVCDTCAVLRNARVCLECASPP
ncbi:hypothetical protein AC578_10007 [Pseudocercospora eumusae]|uniref:Uncharacterized protein n=1 Tax=Pseudocercospora eumusae TaxID=321146 RepID=A0A139HMC4_9PEZI|nr:hypothetical protein AC578_10007 [Pseudocercospora eumusae]